MLDLLIVGGGPAGLVAALAAARAGLSAMVLEPRRFPIDKACGEGLMPAGAALLAGLGVCPGGRRFTGIRYVDGDCSVLAPLRVPGLAVRRVDLHLALAAAVAEAGVPIRTGTADQPVQDGVSVRCAGLRARYLIAADGLHSPVARSLGLTRPAAGPRRWGQRAHFAVPAGDLVEVHWSRIGEAYLTPVAENLLGVAVLTSHRQPFEILLDDFPAVRARLAGAAALTPVLAAGPLRRRTYRRVAGRVLLAGDAAGYVDALTGEGLGLALRSAAEAVRCIASGEPERYESRWRTITRTHRIGTTALLTAAASATLRPRIVPAAARHPRLFAALVNAL